MRKIRERRKERGGRREEKIVKECNWREGQVLVVDVDGCPRLI